MRSGCKAGLAEASLKEIIPAAVQPGDDTPGSDERLFIAKASDKLIQHAHGGLHLAPLLLGRIVFRMSKRVGHTIELNVQCAMPINEYFVHHHRPVPGSPHVRVGNRRKQLVRRVFGLGQAHNSRLGTEQPG